jgi:hypothetical protein
MATPFRPTRPWPVRTGHGDAVRAAGDPQRSSLPPHSLAVVTNHRHCVWSRSVAVPRLAEHPVVNAAIVTELLEVSEQSARVAVSKLANLGVLTEFTPQTVTPTRPGRPRQWWVASELLVLLGR